MIIMSTRYVLPTTSKLIFAPIGDIHHNASGFDRDRFVDSIQWLKDTSKKPDRKVMVPLMGDELELLSGSERRSYRASGLHGSTRAWMEQRMMDDLLKLYEDLVPIKHLIPHVIAGNHNFVFQESSVKTSQKYIGKSVSQILAEMLGVPCLGICGVHVLELTQSEKSTSVFPFKIFMHHGFGVASSKAASIRQLIALKEKFPMCNLYIMGHNHVKIGTTTEGIDFRKNSKSGAWEMCDVVQGFVRSASFLKGYVEGEYVDDDTGSYVEQKCLVPAGLGIVTANLRWKQKRDSDGHLRYTGFQLHTQE